MRPRCLATGSWLPYVAATSRQAACQIAPFLVPSLHALKPPRRRSSTLAPPTGFPSRPSTRSKPPAHRSLTTTAASRDTIFALASGAGRAGVAIIRISGPLTARIYFSLTRTSLLLPYTRLPPSHKLVLRNIHHPSTGELLDSGAGLIYFPPGRSYTGEASLELHVHGGSATVGAVLEAVSAVEASARMAQPGEFTRRAFENGRLDLASAEALHGLVSAEASVQRRVALEGASGRQTQRFEAIRERLLRAMVMVEALIDFSDEDGVEEGTWSAAKRSVDELAQLLHGEVGAEHDGQRHIGEILTSGVRLAIYGPPNAGKSSLLNMLADRNAAIVSDVPGTTRDVLQVHLDLNGYKVIVSDTAGIRDAASDEVERIGIERARNAVECADLALLVLPATQTLDRRSILRPQSYAHDDPDLVFFNKSDLLTSALPEPDGNIRSWQGSIRTTTGLSTLITDLALLISRKYALNTTEAPLITSVRHRLLLRQCLAHIEAFQRLAHDQEVDLVLAAEELRYAAMQIGKVTGRDVGVEEILGSIFATFCIGK